MSISLPQYKSNDDTGYFRTEAAFHYRFAKIIADNQIIPIIDYQSQFPEGIRTYDEYPLVSEFTYGILYKLLFLNKINFPFHTFIIIVNSLFSSLNVFIIYFLSNIILKNKFLSFITAFIYCFSPASFDRTIGWYNQEDFALPFIFLSNLYFFKKDRVSIIIVLLSLGIALLSWHFMIFYLSLFSLAVLVDFHFNTHPKYPQKLKIGNITLLFISLCAIIFFSPYLRNKQAIFSPATIILFSIIVVYQLSKLVKIKNKIYIFIIHLSILSILFIFLSRINTSFNSSYNHVFEIVKNKFIFFGKKPSDPLLLPILTRLYWQGGYNSPNKKEFLLYFISTLPFAMYHLFRTIYYKIRNGAKTYDIQLCVLLLLIFVSYLLFHRFRVLLIFFSCLVFGIFLKWLSNSRFNKIFSKLITIVIIFQICLFLFFLYMFQRNISSYRLQYLQKDNPRVEVIRWIKENLNHESPILTLQFDLGSDILAYTENPVIVNSQFEQKHQRDKVLEIIKSVYSAEDKFLQIVLKYHAKYVIYHNSFISDTSLSSYRYITNHLNNLDSKSIAFLFRYEPNSLNYFTLVKDLGEYKIYGTNNL